MAAANTVLFMMVEIVLLNGIVRGNVRPILIQTKDTRHQHFDDFESSEDPGARCFGACTCYDMNHTVDCVGKEYTTVPQGIPVNTLVLELESNSIPAIRIDDFQDLTKLEILNLGKNEISTIGPNAFEQNLSLKRLVLNRNPINSIRRNLLNQLSSLEYLDLGYTSVNNIATNTFSNLTSLTTLNLESNVLFSLNNGSFHGLSSLLSLDVSGSYMYEVPMNALDSVRNTISSLSMSYSSRLTAIGEQYSPVLDLPKLQILNLSHSNIRFIGNGTFDHMPKLNVLDLTWNALIVLLPKSFSGLSELRTLRMGSNYFLTFPYAALKPVSQNLTHLELSGFSFTELSKMPGIFDTTFLSNLQYLSLDENQLGSISGDSFFTNLIRLDYLSLSSTNFTVFPVDAMKNLESLKTLHFTGSQIVEISADDLGNLGGLQEIVLSRNRFQHLDADVFSELQYISTIDISQNRLETPKPDWFQAKSVDEIRMLGNPWKCDCNASDYREWTESEEYQNISSKDYIECYSPRSMRGHVLESTSGDTLTCEKGSCPDVCICDKNTAVKAVKRISAQHQMTSSLDELANDAIYSSFMGVRPETKILSSNKEQTETVWATCTMTELTSMPLVPNTTTHLDVTSNKITALTKDEFARLTQLEVFLARDNMISYMENDTFSGSVSLTEIDISKNSLSGSIFPEWFAGLGNLTELRIDNNDITGVEYFAFADLRSLVILDMSDNRVKNLSQKMFTGLESLEFLNVASNEIALVESGAFQDLKELRYLYLGRNMLKTIPSDLIELNHALVFLDISSNIFDSIGHEFIRSENLEVLIMENGYITDLSNGSFSAMPNLKTLRLGGGYISRVEPDAFWLNSSAFGGPSYDIPSPLLTLDLQYNNILEIPVKSFRVLKNLETLGMHGNAFTSIPARDNEKTLLPMLTTLYLANSPVTTISENSFISQLASLKALVMNGCELSALPTYGIQSLLNLAHLVINSNPVTEIGEDFASFANLVHLEISDTNTLTSISEAAFDNNKKLDTLLLSNGRIKYLGSNMFKNLINLRVLTLSGNELSYPDPQWFKGLDPNNLRTLTLYDNAWICDCHMSAYKQWVMSEENDFDSYFTSITCNSPQNFRTWDLDEVPLEQLVCETTTQLATTSVEPTTPSTAVCERCILEHDSFVVNCSRARLTSVPRPCIPTTTETLILTNNLIASINDGDLDGLSNLIEIKLDNNRLRSVSTKAFASQRNLFKLDLSQNRLSEVPSDALVHLGGSLKFLIMNDQQFSRIGENAFPLPNLEDLSLRLAAGNLIAPLAVDDFAFSGVGNLKRLDFSENSIRSLDDDVFTGLYNLEHLDIANTGLRSFPENVMRRLPSLTHLTLDNNDIPTIGPVIYPILAELQYFSARHTNVISITDDSFLKDCKELVELNVGYSSLDAIPNKALQNKPHFSSLSMDNSLLPSLFEEDFSGLQTGNITVLNFAGAQVTEIGDNAFRDLSHLKMLDLQSNALGIMGNDPLQGTELQYLDLSYNNLTYVSCTWFHSLPRGQLQTLILSPGNRYHCSCEMVGFREYMESPQFEMIPSVAGPICSSPPEFFGMHLEDVAREDIQQYCQDDVAAGEIVRCDDATTTVPISTTSGGTSAFRSISSTERLPLIGYYILTFVHFITIN